MINTFLDNIYQKSINNETLTKEECKQVLTWNNDDILLLLHTANKIKNKFKGKKIQIQTVLNAKSGFCTEDCHYCSQSCISKAIIEKYQLTDTENFIKGAKYAKENNAMRYCMVLSGIRFSDATIDKLAASIKEAKKAVNMPMCCSIGFLTEKQAKKLKDAGLDRINHNLNTSENFYPNVCGTHTYQERIDNIRLCKKMGFELCCGGIIGVGETIDDDIDFLLALKEFDPESIPLNFLIPIKGTLMENYQNTITPLYCLKILCLARFLHPTKDIRAAGGREYRIRTLQPLILYAANSIFVTNYATEKAQKVDEGLKMIQDLELEIEYESCE